MKNTQVINKLNNINRKNKERLLLYLINLEKQENSYNQEPASVSLQKDD